MARATERLDNLQITRAVAMILVLLIHADFFSTKILKTPILGGVFSPGGDAGVDIFFVLSGFIIYYIHHLDINQKSKFWPYIIKRFSRIYPTYWIVTLLTIPLFFIFPQFGLGNETNLDRIIYSIFLLPSTEAPIVHAAWTLIYEVLFYLTFALLILFGFKKMLPFIISIIIFTVIGWIYSINNIVAFQNSIYYIFFSYHNFEFLIGIVGAYLVINKHFRYEKIFLLLSVIILVSMLLFEYYQNHAYYHLRLFGYGIPAFLIISSLSSIELNKAFILPNNIWYRFLLFLGNASFSIYLTHQFLISGIGRILSRLDLNNLLGGYGIILITITLTLFFGCIFHLIIEKPLLNLSRNKLLSFYKSKN